jgi:hypothetical protein
MQTSEDIKPREKDNACTDLRTTMEGGGDLLDFAENVISQRSSQRKWTAL